MVVRGQRNPVLAVGRTVVGFIAGVEDLHHLGGQLVVAHGIEDVDEVVVLLSIDVVQLYIDEVSLL